MHLNKSRHCGKFFRGVGGEGEAEVVSSRKQYSQLEKNVTMVTSWVRTNIWLRSAKVFPYVYNKNTLSS